MDSKTRRGFLEACVLTAVNERESYGYQIIRDVPAALGLTESTLYPLLKRLEAAHCISVRSAEHNGRLRKYYRTTDEGKARIEDFLADWPDIEAVYRYVAGERQRADTECIPVGAVDPVDSAAAYPTDSSTTNSNTPDSDTDNRTTDDKDAS